ncbi:MAG: carboxymuconolactone decarboxylase family protein [Betaproteobacteria bacterium]
MSTQQKIDALEENYKHILGFVPERIHSRITLGIETAAEMTEGIEKLRAQLLEPEALDLKTSQLMAFGMLLMNLSQAAENHAVAALRAGATVQELQATAGIAFVFRGIPAINLSGEAIAGALKKVQALNGASPDSTR